MMGKEVSTRARGGASSRDARGGSKALAAPARMSYQSHMKKMAGRKKQEDEEVDAAIARAVAARAGQRGPPVGTNAPADAVDGGQAPSRNSKASGRRFSPPLLSLLIRDVPSTLGAAPQETWDERPGFPFDPFDTSARALIIHSLSFCSRGAQMAAMAAGRNKATGKAPVEEEEDEDEVLEVSSGEMPSHPPSAF